MGELSSFGRTMSIFTLCFFLIGFVHAAPLMYVITLFCLAVMVAATLFAFIALRGIDCRRETPGATVFSGDPLEATVKLVEKRSRWRMLVMFDQYTNMITGKTVRRRMTLLTEGGRAKSAMAAGSRQRVVKQPNGSSVVEVHDVMRFAQRGHYRLGPITVESHDPFGLLSQSRTFPVHQEVIVYPRPLPIPELVVGGGGARRQTEIHPMGRAGESADFHGIRPYVHGDDLRRVHWKSTAHTGKLAIKEFEYQSSGAVEVILDLQQGVHIGDGEFSTLEAAITLAASVLNHVVRTGNQVGLLTTSAKLVRLQHESGEPQLHRALETLALARDDGAIPLAQALANSEMHSSRRSTAIVITPSVDLHLIDALLALRGRSAQLLLVLLNPRNFYQAEKDQERIKAREHLFSQAIDLRGLANLISDRPQIPSEDDHRTLLHAASAAGIEVFPIGADLPLHQALQGIRNRM